MGMNPDTGEIPQFPTEAMRPHLSPRRLAQLGVLAERETA
jgi:hypothetical protein